VTHPLTPNLGLNDFDTAFFANDASVLHPFVFAAITFVIFDGTENLGTEKPVSFRFKGPVIDGLGLFDLPVGPFPDLLRRSH
jgi:hypothetical protein